MSEQATVETLHCLPWESMLKAEKIDHLIDYHGVRGLSRRDPETSLTGTHEADHQDWSMVVRGLTNRSRRPVIDHDHNLTTVNMSGDAIDAKLAVALEKPLSSTQRSQLKALVDNDFAELRQQIGEFYHGKRMEAENADFSVAEDKAKRLGQVTNAYKLAHRAMMDADKALRDEAAKLGVDVTIYSGREEAVVNFQQTGVAQKLSSARNQIKAEADAALMALERRRLAVQRQIMLAGLPKETREMLDSLPTAAELMREATEAKAIENV